MIHVDWVDPNFTAEIEDLDGVVVTEIHHAPDEATLRACLDARVTDKRIRAIRAVRSYDFARWLIRAENARRGAQNMHDAGRIADWEPNSAVWSDLKPFLIQLFRGKCAYCEATFAHVDWGDVEHYRPKKKVTDENDVEATCGAKPHPGYFWLAYEPRNLLPSCKLCNEALAKMNRFPVAGPRACKPGDDVALEQPLLLHPYEHVPSGDLTFVPTLGTVAGATPRGSTSTKVYRLNRERLIEQRRKEQSGVRTAIKMAFANENAALIGEIRRQCGDGEREFSQAALAEINNFFTTMGVKLS